VNGMPSLFDANGSCGRPSVGAPDCPTVADRLAHMDRLGIERSLVWNVEGEQDNSLSANRRLLDEIAATPGTPGRIVAAPIVSGVIVYERGGVEKLTEQMREAGTGALRFVSVYDRLKLMQCEPVINAVRELKPFILLKGNDPDARDILNFTERFPDVPVILTNVMWTGAMGAMELMRRRPNVLVEISGWHTWNGAAMLVKHFGADRVLFGTGFLSHNGAAIAALARAEVSEDTRAAIAHGNLDRLTGLSPKSETADLSKGNDLWRHCLAGEPLGVDIVDAHGHIGPLAGYVLENQGEADQIRVLLAEMDRLGQRTTVVSALAALMGAPAEGNDFLYRLLKPHADRLSIYAVFNPFYASDLVPRLDDWFADPQFVGFKTLCSYWKVKISDPRFDPMWEYANRHRLPVLMHSWEDSWCSPAMTRDIVRKYTDMSLLVAHAGGTGRGRLEAEELAAEFPNVFIEWCGSFCTPRRWEDTLKTVPPSQVVYGTDAAAHDMNWELGRLLSLDVPEDVMIPILGATMRRILARRR